MNLFPNPQELVSEETIEEVKYIEEISQHQAFKTAISREELNEISKQDLLETVEWAKGHQEENADRLKKKTRQFGVATGTMSFPLAHEDAPVTLSLTGSANALLYGYRELFSKELDFREWVIENGTYSEVTGNIWIDNWRHQWNIRCCYTKFLFQLSLAWLIYELSPRIFQIIVEDRLNQQTRTSFTDWAFKLGAKYRGESDLNNFNEAEQAFPLDRT